MSDTQTHSQWNRTYMRSLAIPPMLGLVASLGVMWGARTTRIGPPRGSSAEVSLLLFVFVLVASMTQFRLSGGPKATTFKAVTKSVTLAFIASGLLYILGLVLGI